MAQIPFVTDNARNNIPVNWFPAKDSEVGVVLWGTPGLTKKTATTGAGCRGMRRCASHIYGVSGGTAWRLSNDWTLEELGSLSASRDPVTILDNGPQVMFFESGAGYVYTLADGSLVDCGATFIPESATYQDGYCIASEKDAKNFYISGLHDATSWDALDYSTSEVGADSIVTMISSHRELWIFHRQAMSVWYNSGSTDFPFERIAGANIELGCIAPTSVCMFDGALVWLSNRLQIVQNVGYQPQIISTRKLEREIEQLTITSDAMAFSYTQDGHEFYVISFPTDGKTWAYDAETKVWHQRTSGTSGGRWRVAGSVYMDGIHAAGDFENEDIYQLSGQVYSEDGETIVRTLETNATQDTTREGRLVHFSNLEVFWNGAGYALQSGQGSDPQAMLQWSDDGGATWGNEHWADIGLIGKYKNRCRWNRLGASRDRVWRLMLSDPVEPTIMGAMLGMK